MKKILIYSGLITFILLMSGVLHAQKRAPKMQERKSNSSIFRSFKANKEIIEKRSQYALHYKNERGNNTAIISSGGSIHYKKNGKWERISNKLKSNTKRAGYNYACTENAFKSFYSLSSNNGVKTEFVEGSVVEWKNPEIAWLDANGNIISVISATQSNAKVSSNTMLYSSVFNGMDVRFMQKSDGRKMEVIINNKSIIDNRPASAKTIVFYENIEIPNSWSTQNIIGQDTNAVTEVLLIDQSGEVIVNYSRPKYFEKTSDGFNNLIRGIYKTEINNNILKIGMEVSVQWLADSLRSYPIVIDPTGNFYPSYTSYHTGSVYNGSYSVNADIDVGFYDRTWPSSNERSHAWARFDISSVPDIAEITYVGINLTHYSYNNSGGVTEILFGAYGDNTDDPVTETSSQRYNNIYNGTGYGSYNFNGTSSFTLSPSGASLITDVEDRLVADWYVMGFWSNGADGSGGGGDDSHYHYFYGYDGGGSKPYLEIDYCAHSPVADAGSNDEICTNSTSLAAGALTGSETGEWTVYSGPASVTTASSRTSGVTDLGNGANIFKWTVSLSDGVSRSCESVDYVTITNSSVTTPNAGSNQTVCSSSTTLSANYPTNGTGTWSVVSGSGTFTDNTSYNTIVSNLTGSDGGYSNEFKWTIINGTGGMCTDDDTVIITYAYPPVANAGPAQTDCFGTSTCTLAGNNPASLAGGAGSGVWTLISGDGTFTSNTTYNTTITDYTTGTGDNTYRWTITHANGICTATDNVIITNTSPTTANAGPDQSVSGTTTTLAGNNPAVGTGTWTCTSGVPALGITTPAAWNSGVTGIAGNTTYTMKWSITSGSCPATEDEMEIYYDAGLTGLVIESDLTNNGTFIQSDDPNYFYMKGGVVLTPCKIDGAAETVTNAKVRIKGVIEFDGSIASGEFGKTYVESSKSFTINSSKTYKNNTFDNFGTTNLNANSKIENSGNWTNSNIVNADITSEVLFNGAANQNVTAGGDDFGKVSFKQSVTSTITLQDDMTLKTSAQFQMGVVDVNSHLLIFNDNATTSGANDNSYVDGQVKKIGNQAFSFPVGNKGQCLPITITAPTIATDEYTAQYFVTDPDGPYNSSLVSGDIDHVSTAEYWTLDRTNGTSTVYVTLEWDNTYNYDGDYVGVTDLNDILVAKWDGTKWEDYGNGGTTGTVQAKSTNGIGVGSVKSNLIVDNTGPFTLGSKSKKNPLPTELLYFAAVCSNNNVQLKWATASETNNDYFLVEKSTDAVNFEYFDVIPGAGNSNQILEYDDVDNTPNIINYYRLKQVDYDAKFSYSEIVSAKCDGSGNSLIANVNVDNSNINIMINSSENAEVLLYLYDYNRRKILEKKVTVNEGNSIIKIDKTKFASGLYLLNILSGDKRFTEKIVIQN